MAGDLGWSRSLSADIRGDPVSMASISFPVLFIGDMPEATDIPVALTTPGAVAPGSVCCACA